MNTSARTIDRTYRVYGDGGQGACVAVQSILQEHGLCGYTEWNSPEWHFTYLTHLEAKRVFQLLGELTRHFKVRVENGQPVP